eukprot:365576-Pleurochrysis_carterae.AAC.1
MAATSHVNEVFGSHYHELALCATLTHWEKSPDYVEVALQGGWYKANVLQNFAAEDPAELNIVGGET